MDKSTLVLSNYSVLDTDATKAKFLFKLNKYSNVKNNRLSRNFYFAGHCWKLQARKQNEYFGIFLRWFGTEKKDQKKLNMKVSTSLKFSVVNRFLPEISITEGKDGETDVFKRLGGGFGYGKLITLEELGKTPGFIVCDNLYLQLYLQVNKTSYQDSLPCKIQSESNENFIKGERFNFYGAVWYLVFFPQGEQEEQEEEEEEVNENENENNKNKSEANSSVKQKLSSIYLMREVDEKSSLIRHNVKFNISSQGGTEFTVEQHYHGKNNNIFGSTAFISVTELEKMAENESNNLQITVGFQNILPYFLFSYETEKEDEKRLLGDGFQFSDYFSLPWSFKFIEKSTNENIKGDLTLNKSKISSRVNNWTRANRAVQASWNVSILNPSDIAKSISLVARRKKSIRESVYEKPNISDTVEILVTTRKLFNTENDFLDDEGKLSVRLTMLGCNSVEIVSQDEVKQTYQEMCKYHELHQKEFLQLSIEENTLQSDGEEKDDELLKSLHDHVDAYEKYIKDLEKNPKQAKDIHDERSIQKLKNKSRPTFGDHRNLTALTKQIERIIQTLPLTFSKIVYAGALAEGTIVANHMQIDYILHLKGYTKQKHKLKSILNIIKERIREHSSKNPSDTSIERSSLLNTALPYTHQFYSTRKGLLFKAGVVNITMLISRSTDIFPNDVIMYKKSATADRHVMSKYITLVAEKQVKFIDEQTDRCKDLICVVKSWSDGVRWKTAGNRPSSYLISLLLIHAYEKVQKKAIAKTPSFDKEVLLEFALCVNNNELKVEWNRFYKSKRYNITAKSHPFIRDPALPYHNVCQTGIINWKQFQDELDEWVTKLTF